MNCFALFDVVLRVVVLLEYVAIWKSCAKKRKQSISEDIFSQKICIHNAIKNDQRRWSSLRNGAPAMQFQWMLGLWYSL